MLLSALLSGCGDGTSAPAAPAAIRPKEGAYQAAPVGRALPAPIVAEVVDEKGAPVPGVRVDWTTEGDGQLYPGNTVSDADGKVSARWVLGAQAGPNRATVGSHGLAPATFIALGESVEDVPIGEVRAIHPPTYESSDQMVHPDYVRTEGTGFRYPDHLALTPYPYGNAGFENPSVFVAEGRPDRWILEQGVRNPIARPTAGYLSDPDILYDPSSRELRLYYRQADRDNVILLTRSTDGVAWSAPVEVLRRPNHEVVSPTVVRRGPTEWLMWSVNSGVSGCGAEATTVELRRSTDGVSWSAPEPVSLEQDGLFPWHIDVQWIPSRQEYWAVFNSKLPLTCTTPVVSIATSPDGVTWRVADKPVITKGRVSELQDIVYRTTMAYDPASDVITFWYSGARFDGGRYVWGAAVERRLRGEVFAPSAGLRLEAKVYAPAPAPLEVWP
ncbi:MAG TPA: hypothetical protein VJQ44_02700 [Gemmatimonadales bacterium]|nr:hypothetical protein [Gemmatimonadales bacterium]